MRIGIDIMGGDFMPVAPVAGAVSAFRKNNDPDLRLVLIGPRPLIEEELRKHEADPASFDIIHTENYIGMSENPTKAIAKKPDSTINLGIGMLKEGKLDAFISAGNTGAVFVASILGLGNIPGVLRPTIGVVFPHPEGLSLLCDVGANVDCKPEFLEQFGILGTEYMRLIFKVENPKVALLNIGEEESKGPQVIQAAYQRMQNNPAIDFAGNAEGRDIFSGKADVYVCDGFTGNILLKFGESFYDLFKGQYQNDQNLEKINFENYGGIPILGVNGISIIGHGISSHRAFEMMITKAAEAVRAGLTEKIKSAFRVRTGSDN